MPPQSTKTRGHGGRGWRRARESSDNNESWSSRIVWPTIQPKLQPIAGPSSSNDDLLVNDSRDDTYVSIDIGRRGISANETTLYPSNNL